MRPSNPLPGISRKSFTIIRGTPLLAPYLAMACAIGWVDPFSRFTVKAKLYISSPAVYITFVTDNFPSVKVPVLSIIIALIWPAFSKNSALLMSTPCSAPRPDPTIMDVGVANPNAHGQAMTSTAVPCSNASPTEDPNPKYQIPIVRIAIPMTTGTK